MSGPDRTGWIRRRTAILPAAAAALCLLQTAAPAAPGKTLSSKGFTSSQVCGSCHKEIFETWKNSMHALSLEDPVFRVAYDEAYVDTQGGAKKICISCHSPTTMITGDLDLNLPISKEGVTCDFCHSIVSVTPGAKGNPFTLKVGTVKRGSLNNVTSPAHGTVYSEVHERATLCAGCHEYKNRYGITILGTFSEWTESPQAKGGVPCQSCHMPRLGGEIVPPDIKEIPEKFVSTHGVAGGHSLTQLKKALRVKIDNLKRDGNTVSGIVAVTNAGSGHAIPTGMPSRRLILTIEAKTTRKTVYTEQRVFQKVVTDAEGAELHKEGDFFIKGAKISKDTRIRPGETRQEAFSFTAPPSIDLDVSALVTYAYEPLILQKGEIIVDVSRDDKVIGAQ